MLRGVFGGGARLRASVRRPAAAAARLGRGRVLPPGGVVAARAAGQVCVPERGDDLGWLPGVMFIFLEIVEGTPA